MFVLLISLSSSAQDSSVIFRAKLVDEVSGEGVGYAHILIESRNLGITSTIEGDFSLLAHINDSIRITAIGYEDLIIVLDEYYNLDNVKILEMVPAVYELETVEITPYLSYAELREAIVNYEMSDDEKMYLQVKNHLKKMLKYKEASGDGGLKLGGPVSALYNAFSKHAKSQRKLRKFKKEDRKEAIIFRKYNPEIVKNLTGIKDEETVRKFMDWCNLPDEYLLAVTDLDLYKNLINRYEAYIVLKN
jgi:hypothetical protein